MLCAECEQLWERHFFGSLAQRLFVRRNGVIRGRQVSMNDVYGLMCQFDILVRARLN